MSCRSERSLKDLISSRAIIITGLTAPRMTRVRSPRVSGGMQGLGFSLNRSEWSCLCMAVFLLCSCGDLLLCMKDCFDECYWPSQARLHRVARCSCLCSVPIEIIQARLRHPAFRNQCLLPAEDRD